MHLKTNIPKLKKVQKIILLFVIIFVIGLVSFSKYIDELLDAPIENSKPNQSSEHSSHIEPLKIK